MSDIAHAFFAGRDRAEKSLNKDEQHADRFQQGAAWVETVLVPAVKQANEEMHGSGAALRLDLNLDHRSTNHPHCDFWFVQTDSPSGQSYDGPKYSINVTEDCAVQLYKTGAPGRSLGMISTVGPNELRALLREAAQEYGTLYRAA
jgi:hypothetical protein